ncbi:MAG TPA: valine--tRNA ligase [Gemmatimonadaceae bacterium]|nr:valine--tRNA ligase [Gemmatimonadaceae bacterium]
MTDIPAQYDAAATERAIYEMWTDAGVYVARGERSTRAGGERVPFVIVMPPPNVTAILHVGHGLNNTVQDVLTRWRRMAGDEALWLPGMDHAGIATQNVVERIIRDEEGKTRFDYGREAFVAKTTCFVEETGGAIIGQLKAIGASADWSRTAYTLSPELSRAVREAFVRLFEKGLIYRGHRVIHWCPRCMTSLSDEEAEFNDETGKLYHISYPVAGDPQGRALTIATTRPETMLADVAVAVNPEDDRYRDLVGKSVVLPIVGIEIPVIADAYADPKFGTGVVKITPAHDTNDFEVGRRHNLPMPIVISPTATMEAAGAREPSEAGARADDAAGRVPAELRGLDRFEARERIVDQLRADGRLEKVETHQHAVRHCYRCNTVVEPRLSDQWFVKMEPLARPALDAVRTGKLRILPERWEAVYVDWMEKIRDWNISRQIWWGHRVPVWYCDACGHTAAYREDPTACPQCGGTSLRQDEDVLDTWFSSWLWPISTLGWPDEESPDLKAFYPTDVLVTAPEILFFWVARMVMSGYEFMGRTPFHTVLLHGTVRDTQHRKMSKSLGNGIDPLDVVDRYGADALRFTLISGMGLGADVILDPSDIEKSFAVGRNFATKLWNIGRFLLTNVGGDPVRPVAELDPERLTLADRWILGRLDAAVYECDCALGPPRPSVENDTWKLFELRDGLRLNEYAEAARRFVWSELADWYLESVKHRLGASADAEDREVARAVLVHAFDQALRLLHPIIPFITEALWQRLPGREPGQFVTCARWPERRDADAAAAAGGAGESFELVRQAVNGIRTLRGEYNVPPARQIEAVVRAPADARRVFEDETATVGRLTRAALRFADEAPHEAAGHVVLPGGTEIIIPLAGLVDVDKECKRLRGELEQLGKQLASLRQRLANENFVSRAKPEIVEAERKKEGEWAQRHEQLAAKVRGLCGE